MKKPNKKTIVVDAKKTSRHNGSPAPVALLSMQLAEADLVKVAAAEYCLFHFPTLYTAGVPRPALDRRRGSWFVPIVVVHPEHGVIGEVGELTVDARAKKVVRSTPTARVLAAGRRLFQENANGFQAASAVRADQGR